MFTDNYSEKNPSQHLTENQQYFLKRYHKEYKRFKKDISMYARGTNAFSNSLKEWSLVGGASAGFVLLNGLISILIACGVLTSFLAPAIAIPISLVGVVCSVGVNIYLFKRKHAYYRKMHELLLCKDTKHDLMHYAQNHLQKNSDKLDQMSKLEIVKHVTATFNQAVQNKLKDKSNSANKNKREKISKIRKKTKNHCTAFIVRILTLFKPHNSPKKRINSTKLGLVNVSFFNGNRLPNHPQAYTNDKEIESPKISKSEKRMHSL